jgi:hypothetical protein
MRFNLPFGAKIEAIAAALNPFHSASQTSLASFSSHSIPVSRSGNTGVPAARRRKFKQRGRAAV